MAAPQIVAEPGTLTGSIGIFGGKIVTGGVFAKLGANIEVDEKNDSVKLRANAKGARISVRSGDDSVTLHADDLHAAIRLKQGALSPPATPGKPTKPPKPTKSARKK